MLIFQINIYAIYITDPSELQNLLFKAVSRSSNIFFKDGWWLFLACLFQEANLRGEKGLKVGSVMTGILFYLPLFFSLIFLFMCMCAFLSGCAQVHVSIGAQGGQKRILLLG